jgi:hypothetical protein
MRYRMHSKSDTEQERFDTEDELIDAISTRGWDMQYRAAQELVDGRARRFRLAREAAAESHRPRRQ